MNSIKTYLNSLGRSTRVLVLALAVVVAGAGIAQAATTISTNITTAGTLSVTDTSTLTGLTSMIQASSTRLSVHDTAYFGGSATSSFSSAGVLTLQNGETISNATNNLITVTAASTTLTGTLALTGGTMTSSGLFSIGTISPAATVDVSGNAVRTAGLQLNLVSSGATVTGFRGIDSRVADTGTAASVVGVQGVATHSAGVSSGELWGGNLLAHLTGGTIVNTYGAVGSTDVQTGATVGADSGDPNVVAGVFATSFVSPTATLSNDIIDAPLIAQVEQSTGRAKATAAIVALLQGDSQANSAGAAFKVIDHQSTAGRDFDYGLDFGAGPGGPIGGQATNGANAFTIADIRLAKGDTIKNTAASTTVMSGAFMAASLNFASAAAVAGTGDAVTIDFTPDFPALAAGLRVTFVAEAANTTAATLAIDGGTAKAINESANNSALEAGDIASGSVVELVYDGTAWQQVSQSGNSTI